MRRVYEYRKLPRDFTYVLTKRHIRALDERFPDTYWRSEFRGISSSDSGPHQLSGRRIDYWSYHVGVISALRHDDGWIFDLEIDGIRRKHLGETRESLGQQLVEAISAWAKSLNDLPETSPKSGYEIYLGVFDIKSRHPGKVHVFVPHGGRKPDGFDEGAYG